jgi:hypothetical protein
VTGHGPAAGRGVARPMIDRPREGRPRQLEAGRSSVRPRRPAPDWKARPDLRHPPPSGWREPRSCSCSNASGRGRSKAARVAARSLRSVTARPACELVAQLDRLRLGGAPARRRAWHEPDARGLGCVDSPTRQHEVERDPQPDHAREPDRATVDQRDPDPPAEHARAPRPRPRCAGRTTARARAARRRRRPSIGGDGRQPGREAARTHRRGASRGRDGCDARDRRRACRSAPAQNVPPRPVSTIAARDSSRVEAQRWRRGAHPPSAGRRRCGPGVGRVGRSRPAPRGRPAMLMSPGPSCGQGPDAP